MGRGGLAKNYEGRLFVVDGRLHLVTEVNLETDTARVCCRQGDRPTVQEIPLSEVGAHLAEGSDIQLDALNAPRTQTRVEQRPDGWFFPTRDGVQGPFESNQAATQALDEYLLVAQSQRQQQERKKALGQP